MTSQNDRLLDYLKQHKTIDPLRAWSDIGVYRLAARCHDLKCAGHKITKATVKVRNRFGEECRVAQYRLEEEGSKKTAGSQVVEHLAGHYSTTKGMQ